MQIEYPHIDFGAAARIRCVLVPVGLISAERFDFFASFMERNCAEVRLGDVTRDPNDKTLLQHQRWSRTRIHFSFRRAPSTYGSPEERPLALREDLYNDLESVQAHKKIVCAIGILHCPTSASPKDDYEDFCKLLENKYASAAVVRCFAMEKNAQQEPVSGCPDMMEIPVCDEAKTRFYYSTLMQDFTYAVLRSFETELARKAADPPPITTPLDVDVSERQMRAMQLGRLNKTKGDYCLLAGSPQDALIFYESAKIECKKQGDFVWLGAAQEGACSALLLIGEKEEQEVIAQFQDALYNYNRGKGLALELEGYLKLARWNREKGDILEACSLLMTCHSLSQNVSAQNKVVLLTGLCFEFQQMGLYRKFAFFMRELAMLYEQLQMHGTRERILLLSAPFFQVHELGPKLLPHQDRPRSQGECPVSQRQGWGALSTLTLLELVKVAQARDDSISCARYITYLLRRYPDTTTAKTQQDLANLLLTHTRRLLPCVTMDMCGLPLVKSVEIISAQNVESRSVQPTPGKPAGGGGGGGVFIFNPAAKSAAKKWEDAIWVQGEVASVRLTLKNQREFNIHIERILLMTRGAPFESFSMSLNVPAKSNKVVHLSGIPLIRHGHDESARVASDTLVVTGVEIQAFHIIGIHHIDAFGHGIQGERAHTDIDVDSVEGPMRVCVVEPVPVLLIESALFNGNHLQILEGVYSHAIITFENHGKLAVTWLRLSVTENRSTKAGVFEARDQVFSWGVDGSSPRDILAHGQMIAPGERFILRLDVYGLVGSIGASFLLEYGGHDPSSDQFFRNEMHHIPIFVHKGLEITDLEVQLCEFGPTEMPTLFELADASHLEGKPLCLLVFEVSNSAKTSFTLKITVDGVELKSKSDYVCSPGSSRLFIVPIARHWISDDELEDVPVPKGQFIRAKQEMSPLQQHALKLEYNYKMYLQRIIKFEWTCTNNQMGLLSLHGVKVDMDVVRKILPAPLSYSTPVGVQLSVGLWERPEKVGELVELAFVIRNETMGVLDAKNFMLELLDQDLDSLLRDEFLVISGLLTAQLSFQAGQKQSLCFPMAFLVPGEYRFRLRSTDEDLNAYCINPTVKVNVQ